MKIYLRQIHPKLVDQNGAVSKEAFKPSSNDQGLLSVCDKTKLPPEEFYNFYTSELNLESIGILGLSDAECKQKSLPVIHDDEPYEGHCSIDFNNLSSGQMKKRARALRDFAIERGWLFEPKQK